MGSIKENIDNVEKRIQAACDRSGRKREDVLLLAVSKTIDVPRIKEAVDCGLTSLGENKVQEIMDKYEPMGEGIHWHLIGHLQTNKVKYIIDKVELIHSVESMKLAEKISKLAQERNLTANILLEVNVAEEESKFGIKPSECEEMVRKISVLPNICIKGLMTVAPFVENPEQNRVYFRQLRQLLVDINSKKIDNVNMDVLSMGMTNDYEIAVEEGATIVRVGTGIFGARVYPNKK
ncbi:MAG: YggS family pyridoxal phosphate-dependent enzyme [Clostridia bacterium]|nr:YggS family pyridoxal phosphate-dependent enzyme [Clostridia bacterium]MCI2001021.1 YggS family pyridoxal phosphate-dependent enzyme [Clostridia bacterium]MCI2015620.1 YggS family pyridoxal phosphate-dependent enzyme [Clostridia bacterium]